MEALLVYLADPNVPLERLAGWPTAYDSFIRAFEFYMLPMERTEMVARMPVILLTVILGAVVFRWGKDLWGAKAGLLALAALVFDPTLLAHGRLATTDAGLATLGTAALYAVWRWTERPSCRWALGAGGLLGLTMLAKVSGFVWTVVAGLIVLATIVQRRREGRSVQLLLQGVAVGVMSLLILWAGYGFTWGLVRDRMLFIRFPFRVPAPAHWESLLYLDQYTSEVFALGQRKYGRWWWYFPLAFLIKNPLPLLIGWAIGLVVLLRRLYLRSRLLVFPMLYAGIAISRGMNIGYRHMLPVHPFLYLMVGGGLWQWGWGRQARSWRRWLLAILGVWYIAATVYIFPYEIAYFNELVGAERGYLYLADSNLDWGQSSRTVEAYLQAHPDVRAEPPPSKFRPPPGRYIVGASYLQGLGIADPYAYEWFRHWEPQEVINYSLLVYDVPPYEMNWIAQCMRPAVPLDEVPIAGGTGRDDLRRLEFDCTQAWLYPGGGAELGIYALHHALAGEQGLCFPSLLRCPTVPGNPFMARHLAQARLSFEQAYSSNLPAFMLYETTSAFVVPDFPSVVYAAPAEISPTTPGGSAFLSSPLALDGPFTFLGAAAYRQEETLEVETWWRVTKGSIPRSFSVMAHLLSPEGENLGVADGLGVSPLVLAAGDVVVQRHRFPRPLEGPEENELWLRTGIYWRDTMELWTVHDAPGSNVLFVPLEGE